MLLLKGCSGAGPCQSVQSSHSGGGEGCTVPIEPRRAAYQLRQKRTSPSVPSCTLAMPAWIAGQLRRCVPIVTTRLCSRAAASASSPSSAVWLQGFSTYTCLPVRQPRIVAGACQWLGAATASTSTAASSSTRRMSPSTCGVRPPSLPIDSAKGPATRWSTSQSVTTSARGSAAKPRASAAPRPLTPMIATRIRSLGPATAAAGCCAKATRPAVAAVAAAATSMRARRESRRSPCPPAAPVSRGFSRPICRCVITPPRCRAASAVAQPNPRSMPHRGPRVASLSSPAHLQQPVGEGPADQGHCLTAAEVVVGGV